MEKILPVKAGPRDPTSNQHVWELDPKTGQYESIPNPLYSGTTNNTAEESTQESPEWIKKKNARRRSEKKEVPDETVLDSPKKPELIVEEISTNIDVPAKSESLPAKAGRGSKRKAPEQKATCEDPGGAGGNPNPISNNNNGATPTEVQASPDTDQPPQQQPSSQDLHVKKTKKNEKTKLELEAHIVRSHSIKQAGESVGNGLLLVSSAIVAKVFLDLFSIVKGVA